MTDSTFDLLGTNRKKSAGFTPMDVIRDTKELIDLAFEIRDAKLVIQEQEQRLNNEVERLNALALAAQDSDIPEDDGFYSIVPDDFTSIDALYTLVAIYQSAEKSNARIALLSNNRQGESNWVAWAKSSIGDEISLTLITYLEPKKKWNRIRIDLPENSVAVFNPGLLRISLPDFNAEGKDWLIEVVGEGKILNFHRTVSNMTQRTSIGHKAIRLTGKDGFDYVPGKGGYHPSLDLVFHLQAPGKERMLEILNTIIDDPFAAFGVTP